MSFKKTFACCALKGAQNDLLKEKNFHILSFLHSFNIIQKVKTEICMEYVDVTTSTCKTELNCLNWNVIMSQLKWIRIFNVWNYWLVWMCIKLFRGLETSIYDVMTRFQHLVNFERFDKQIFLVDLKSYQNFISLRRITTNPKSIRNISNYPKFSSRIIKV